MADIAHELTDRELEKMERHLSAIYARAEKELQEKADAYFKRFEELDAKKRALVDAGKLTEEEYKRWRQNKIMTGKHWTAMKEQAAQELLQANRTAQEYINGRLPGVYSLNYNSTGEAIEGAVSGYSFELVDASTVKNLAISDKTLLPYKYVDGKKDMRWNTAKVNSEVLQGIVQGESIPNIAKRLQNVTEMNRASAIRNARTTVTSAENKGRMDSLHRAAEKGVITHKVWLAAIDARTREAHRLLDGQEQEIDDPFKSELGDIMFPGDPDADPANVYNCRCTLTYKVVGFGNRAVTEEAEFGTVKEFIPAQSIEEAEEYAKKFVTGKTWSGDGNVSFKGLSLDTANAINKELDSIYSSGNVPLLRNIGPMNFRASKWKGNENAPMAYSSVSYGDLFFNPRILKSRKTLMGYFSRGQEAKNICVSNIGKFNAEQQAIIRKYMESPRQLIAETVDQKIEALLDHEIGHHIQHRIIYKNTDLLQSITNNMDLYSVRISGYASNSVGEYIAESYSAYRRGMADIIDFALKEVFDSL